jgi:hypothetical protein
MVSISTSTQNQLPRMWHALTPVLIKVSSRKSVNSRKITDFVIFKALEFTVVTKTSEWATVELRN